MTDRAAFVLAKRRPAERPGGALMVSTTIDIAARVKDMLLRNHSRNNGFSLGACQRRREERSTDSRDARDVAEANSDSESGRDVPTAWTVKSNEMGLEAELEEWGRNLVRYQTDDGKTAVVPTHGSRNSGPQRCRVDAFGLNVHVQDE